MEIIALHNQKGGVGKTTTTINIGAALAGLGKRVLMVDLDPQGNLTSALGIEDGAAKTMLPLALLGRWEGELRELVVSYRDNVDVIPTHEEMFLLEPQLYPVSGREWRLSALLDAMAGAYDVALLDCPPSLGAITDNALVAARKGRGGIVIPVQSERSTIRALNLLYRQLDSLQKGLNIEVDTLGLVVNLYDTRRGSTVTDTYEDLSGIGIPVLATIRNRAAILDSWAATVPVTEFAPKSEETRWYRDLAVEILARLDGKVAR